MRVIEYAYRVGEVNPVFSKVGGSLFVVSLVVHRQVYAQMCTTSMLTNRTFAFAFGAARSWPAYQSGYRKLFLESVTQADRGCDFDFLTQEVKLHVPRVKR